MSPLAHVANGIYLVSYLVRDILWLRVLTCLGGLFFLATFVFRPEPLWEAIGWNLVFLTINVAQIKTLLLERRPVTFRDDEQKLYKLVFRSLRPREFKKLLAIGSWEDRPAGEKIVASGKELDRIMVIAEGRAAVRIGGRTAVELGDGKFIGEMSFLTAQAPAADVETISPMRLLVWPSPALKDFLAHNPELRAALQLVLGTDLVAKLRSPT
jgi:hypothetical protein